MTEVTWGHSYGVPMLLAINSKICHVASSPLETQDSKNDTS